MSKSSLPNATRERQLLYVASSRKDLGNFPDELIEPVLTALDIAVHGDKSDSAVVMQGFGGASVLEIKARHQTDTYCVVYTVRFEKAVYVLHAFQKKSKRGIATDLQDMNLVRARLKVAEEHYKTNFPP